MAAIVPATGSTATASSASKRRPARRSGTTSSSITDCGTTTPPAAPNLIDITVDGKPIKAVAQVTKQAFVYVFDRVTGQPVWPIEEQPVPASSVPGESASKTQPFPTQAGADRHSGRARRRPDRLSRRSSARRRSTSSRDTIAVRCSRRRPQRGTIQVPGVAGGAQLVRGRDRSGNRHALCRHAIACPLSSPFASRAG